MGYESIKSRIFTPHANIVKNLGRNNTKCNGTTAWRDGMRFGCKVRFEIFTRALSPFLFVCAKTRGATKSKTRPAGLLVKAGVHRLAKVMGVDLTKENIGVISKWLERY